MSQEPNDKEWERHTTEWVEMTRRSQARKEARHKRASQQPKKQRSHEHAEPPHRS